MKWLCEKLLLLFGWRFEGGLPDEPRMVVVGFPHTSNWDFFIFLAALRYFDMRVRFLAKAPLFRGPLGWLMRRWGGIPVETSAHHDLVATVVSAFEEHGEMILVIAPEGTRARTDVWKSGFWRIATAADVPVVMAFIDGGTKRVGLGPSRRIDGDPQRWMDGAADFYVDKRGLKPQNRGPVTL